MVTSKVSNSLLSIQQMPSRVYPNQWKTRYISSVLLNQTLLAKKSVPSAFSKFFINYRVQLPSGYFVSLFWVCLRLFFGSRWSTIDFQYFSHFSVSPFFSWSKFLTRPEIELKILRLWIEEVYFISFRKSFNRGRERSSKIV